MAGSGNFLSGAIRGLVDDVEAGSEEGLRIELEKIKDNERREEKARMEKRRLKAEKVRTEEEKRQEMEKIRAEKQKQREDETAFWTTPGLRPLAEPLILDWDWFFRVRFASDARYKKLFPNDPVKIARMKDIDGEGAALSEYLRYAQSMESDPELDPERQEFYANLYEDLNQDWREVDNEIGAAWVSATHLGRFEFRWLDDDGSSTTQIEEWIKKGADIFRFQQAEVREKYSHLVPPDFVETPLATFEFFYTGPEGSTEPLRSHIGNGTDVLRGWPQEVQDKYGHLRNEIKLEQTVNLLRSLLPDECPLTLLLLAGSLLLSA